ncbi:hypothetical protein PLICRDRAFT_88729 [Plicaturopsis crispa FD-325 SS-3]|nr:hypothetical protein PLICRDRAFT_88729 [Plicaturopsis crispa FD-325 SS-3]
MNDSTLLCFTELRPRKDSDNSRRRQTLLSVALCWKARAMISDSQDYEASLAAANDIVRPRSPALRSRRRAALLAEADNRVGRHFAHGGAFDSQTTDSQYFHCLVDSAASKVEEASREHLETASVAVQTEGVIESMTRTPDAQLRHLQDELEALTEELTASKTESFRHLCDAKEYRCLYTMESDMVLRLETRLVAAGLELPDEQQSQYPAEKSSPIRDSRHGKRRAVSEDDESGDDRSRRSGSDGYSPCELDFTLLTQGLRASDSSHATPKRRKM